MGKSIRGEKRNIYDEIRKPIPKTGYAFKSKKQKYHDDGFDDEFDDISAEVDQKILKKLKE